MTTTEKIQSLRQRVSVLASNLVHDCDPQSETCHCFGAADVVAYEDARAALRAAVETAGQEK